MTNHKGEVGKEGAIPQPGTLSRCPGRRLCCTASCPGGADKTRDTRHTQLCGGARGKQRCDNGSPGGCTYRACENRTEEGSLLNSRQNSPKSAKGPDLWLRQHRPGWRGEGKTLPSTHHARHGQLFSYVHKPRGHPTHRRRNNLHCPPPDLHG